MTRFWQFRDGPEPISLPKDVEWEVAYSNDVESGKLTTRSYTHSFFQDDASDWGQRIGMFGLESDPSNHGGGLQILEPQGYLGVHLDYMHHPVVPAMIRAVSIVAFMNKDWKRSWGGALVFCRPDGKPIHYIYPEPRLVVVFENTDLSYHGVEQVRGPEPRITLMKSLLLPAGRSRAQFLPNRA